MGIKRYIILSLVFATAVGLYVFSFEGGQLTKSFFDVEVTLPIALWIILPVFALLLASVVHMAFYYARECFQERARKKDYEHFLHGIKLALLGEEPAATFKTPWFSLPMLLVSRMSPKEKLDLEGIEEGELKSVLELIKQVREGKVVDFKKYKLRQDNPLVIQNKLNQMAQNPKVAAEMVRSCGVNESEVCNRAFEILLQHGTYAEIKRSGRPIAGETVLSLLRRHRDDEDEFVIEDSEFEALLAQSNLSKEEMIEVAKILQTTLNPDALVILFEKLYNQRIEACEAYLYVLFELQMIDRAREVLENSDENDLVKFKLLLFLKDHGKHCNTALFI